MKIKPIKGERIILRELEKSDLDAIHEYATDPEVVRFMPWGPNTPEETKYNLKLNLKTHDDPNRTHYDFAIEHIEDGVLIGRCGIKIDSRFDNEWALGYVLNKKYWGQGYMTEATKLILDFGFKELGLKRIRGACHIDNHGSARVMEKIGMTKIKDLKKGEYEDLDGEPQEGFLFEVTGG